MIFHNFIFKIPCIGNIFKGILIHNISEMTLFKYSEGKCCKSKGKDVSFAFYNVLPANICNKISEYNLYCNQCCITRELEKFFLEEHKDKGYTQFQLQLKFFMTHQQRFPICFSI